MGGTQVYWPTKMFYLSQKERDSEQFWSDLRCCGLSLTKVIMTTLALASVSLHVYCMFSHCCRLSLGYAKGMPAVLTQPHADGHRTALPAAKSKTKTKHLLPTPKGRGRPSFWAILGTAMLLILLFVVLKKVFQVLILSLAGVCTRKTRHVI